VVEECGIGSHIPAAAVLVVLKPTQCDLTAAPPPLLSLSYMAAPRCRFDCFDCQDHTFNVDPAVAKPLVGDLKYRVRQNLTCTPGTDCVYVASPPLSGRYVAAPRTSTPVCMLPPLLHCFR
jgi:hypothetical protein